MYDFQDSKAISCCYPNEVRSFLYEYFANYLYLNYAFPPSSGALVRTTTIGTVRYWLASREMTNFVKYPITILYVDVLFLPWQGIWYNKTNDLPSWQCLFLNHITNSKPFNTRKFSATKILTYSIFVYKKLWSLQYKKAILSTARLNKSWEPIHHGTWIICCGISNFRSIYFKAQSVSLVWKILLQQALH